MHRLQDLVRLHRGGLPARAIARLLRMGRNTVGRYSEALRSAELLDREPGELRDMATLRAAVRRHAPSLPTPRPPTSIERWPPIIGAKYEEGVGRPRSTTSCDSSSDSAA